MTALTDTFKVALYDEFLESFAQIPRAQQKKVSKFIRLFRADPTAASINYEKINSFTDPKLRTVRVDLEYRAIVLKPETGNVMVLLWVGHHDSAMAWAENKRFDIHPETGALQVMAGEPIKPVAGPAEVLQLDTTPLFEHLRERELRRLGVPEAMLSAVAAVTDLGGLEFLQTSLPEEAFEALFFLAEGESLEDVERALAVTTPELVDTTDFVKALANPNSQRRFVFVEDDETLDAMLDAPLEKWRIFLHPSQRRLVEGDKGGPTRVLGGAGTGKTVVAMHRVAWLLKHRFLEPNDRVLFTTFTANLAKDIYANLSLLVPPEALRRIEVVHLDKWVSQVLKRAGYTERIEYFGRNGRLRELWNEALSEKQDERSDAFYRDEWSQVVQAQGCRTWESYKNATRTGRGVRLSRVERKNIWTVFEAYRDRLDAHGLREPEDAIRDALALVAQGAIDVRYRAVVVDEAQDMTTVAFELLRKVVPERPNDMFIVGDGHQRIYRRQVMLGHAGVAIVGRSHRLRINYRTTDEIRKRAVALLAGVRVDDLDGGDDTTKGYTSLMHGEVPKAHLLKSFEEEVDTLVEWLGHGESKATCVVARTRKLRDQYGQALRDCGFQTYLLDGDEAEDRKAEGLRLATMHRVKGLEFDRVALVGLTADAVPSEWAINQHEDKAAREDAEIMERSLLYVALTRARKAAIMTAHGKVSGWFG